MKKPSTPSRAKLAAARKKVAAIVRSLGGTYGVRLYKRRRLRRRYNLRPLSSEERRRETWEHDFEVLLEAAARTQATPEHAIEAAARGADAMARTNEEVSRHVQRFHRARFREWEDLFDRLVHHMSERTSLTPEGIVTRAREITDLAMYVLRRRAAPASAVDKAAE